MLRLRREEHWSLLALAKKYNVSSHAAIQYHCKRHDLYRGHADRKDLRVFYHSKEPAVREVISIVIEWWLPEKDRMNPGKTYKEYIAEYNQRHPEIPLAIPNNKDAIDLPVIYIQDSWT